MDAYISAIPWKPYVHELHITHLPFLLMDYRKGLKDYDVEKAYEGIKKNLTEGTFIPWRQGTPRRPIDDFYHENGYFPALRPGEEETEPQMDGFEKRQPVAVTLGISYDFWALSELAGNLGKKMIMKNLLSEQRITRNYGIPIIALFYAKG